MLLFGGKSGTAFDPANAIQIPLHQLFATERRFAVLRNGLPPPV
jgi:hypothetical protein